MRLFLDTGDPKEVKVAYELFPWLDGVTTTPVLMKKAGGNPIEGYRRMLAHANELHVEALGPKGASTQQIVAEAERITDACGSDAARLVFKVPCTPSGLRACYQMREKDFYVNMHLVYTPNQAIMARAAGAQYICYCAGKSEDEGYESKYMFANIREVLCGLDPPELMFSSVRSQAHIWLAQRWGADAITIPHGILYRMVDNDLTKTHTQEFIDACRALA
jgi:transaldolase